jgi:hypothetical protein
VGVRPTDVSLATKLDVGIGAACDPGCGQPTVERVDQVLAPACATTPRLGRAGDQCGRAVGDDSRTDRYSGAGRRLCASLGPWRRGPRQWPPSSLEPTEHGSIVTRAERIVRRVARRAGIGKRLGPHTLRPRVHHRCSRRRGSTARCARSRQPCRRPHQNALRPSPGLARPTRHRHRRHLPRWGRPLAPSTDNGAAAGKSSWLAARRRRCSDLQQQLPGEQ